MVHIFNPSTQEAEAGGSMSSRSAWSTEQDPGQPGLQSGAFVLIFYVNLLREKMIFLVLLSKNSIKIASSAELGVMLDVQSTIRWITVFEVMLRSRV